MEGDVTPAIPLPILIAAMAGEVGATAIWPGEGGATDGGSGAAGMALALSTGGGAEGGGSGGGMVGNAGTAGSIPGAYACGSGGGVGMGAVLPKADPLGETFPPV